MYEILKSNELSSQEAKKNDVTQLIDSNLGQFDVRYNIYLSLFPNGGIIYRVMYHHTSHRLNEC